MSRAFKTLSRRWILRSGLVRLSDDRVRLPNRVVCRRTLVHHPGAVVVLPLESIHRIILVRQFRYAVGGYLWELPAGTLESGERPLSCAGRELIEEASRRAARWRRIGMFYPAPGVSNERMILYMAGRLTPQTAPRDHDECLRPVTLTARQVRAMLQEGKIRDAKTLVGLYWYFMHRVQIRRWLAA